MVSSIYTSAAYAHRALKTPWPLTALLLIASLLVHNYAYAQSISTDISSRNITTHERLTYTVEAEGRTRTVTPPSSPDFEIVGQSKQTSINFINGKTTRKLTVSYQLAPTRAGELSTGAATVEFKGGRSVDAEQYTIRVTDAGTPAPTPAPSQQRTHKTQQPTSPWLPRAPRRLKSPAAKEFGEYPPLPLPASDQLYTQEDWVSTSDRPFLLAFTNTRNAVVGEPFLVEYLYYEPLSALGFEAHDMDEPEFPNSWFKDISDVRLANQNRILRVRFQGQTYNVQIVRSYMVVPLKEGTFVVPPFHLTIAGYTFTQRMEPFQIQSPKMNVNVEGLPRKGRPPHSTDNVGRYHIRATLQPEEARVGDTIQLNLEVTGVGVPAHVQIPTVSLPEGLHLLSPTERSESHVNSIGWLETTKHKSISFQATQEGDYQIPAIPFHWYDPWENAWKSNETDPFTLRIHGVSARAQQPNDTESPSEENIPQVWVRELLTGENIPDKKGMIAQMRQRGEPWRGTPLYFVLFSTPAAGFLVLTAFTRLRRRRRKTREQRVKLSAKGIARRALNRCSADALESYMQMDQIMRTYLRARGIPSTQGATYEELQHALTITRNAQSAAHLVELLQALEEARYGGSDPVRFHALRAKLLQWLKDDAPDDLPTQDNSAPDNATERG